MLTARRALMLFVDVCARVPAAVRQTSAHMSFDAVHVPFLEPSRAR